MPELPEIFNITRQMNKELFRKKICITSPAGLGTFWLVIKKEAPVLNVVRK